MREGEKEKTVERVARTTVFAMVAIIVITSVALPIFASIGTTTVTTSLNDGMVMSSVNERYASQIDAYEEEYFTMTCNSEGMYMIGEVGGTTQQTKILSSSEYVVGEPLLIVYTSVGHNAWIVTYTGESPLRFIYIAPPGSQIAVSQYSLDIYEGDQVFVQDPKGGLHLEKDEGYYNNLADIYGFSYGTDHFLLVDGSTARLRTDVLRTGTADIDYDTVSGVYEVTNAEFNGYSCEYYLCPDIEITEERDLLNGWGPVKSMIGVIPVLIMIGAILTVAHRMRMSDR